MKIYLALAVVAMVALPGIAYAQTWTTPDGFLSVAAPDSESFIAVPNPPEPFVGLWVSGDESTRLAVIKTPVPEDIRLAQSSVEEGLAEEIGGEVTRLPTKQIAGYDVWLMKGKGPSIEITQGVIRHGGTIYKLMAATLGQEPDEAMIDQFINSLAITRPASLVDPGVTTSPGKRNGNLLSRIDLHELSKKIGGFAALLGIGLIIYFVTRGKNKKNRDE